MNKPVATKHLQDIQFFVTAGSVIAAIIVLIWTFCRCVKILQVNETLYLETLQPAIALPAICMIWLLVVYLLEKYMRSIHKKHLGVPSPTEVVETLMATCKETDMIGYEITFSNKEGVWCHVYARDSNRYGNNEKNKMSLIRIYDNDSVYCAQPIVMKAFFKYANDRVEYAQAEHMDKLEKHMRYMIDKYLKDCEERSAEDKERRDKLNKHYT